MVYKIPNKPKKEKNTFTVENKKQAEKKLFIEDIKKRGEITEREILLVKRRLNDGTYSEEDIEDLYGLKITPEQTKKGYDYLYNKGYGKTGKERSTSPYGYREEEVVKDFKGFKFNGFQNISNYGGFKNYVPVYRAEGKDGSGFEYYVQGGEVKIIG